MKRSQRRCHSLKAAVFLFVSIALNLDAIQIPQSWIKNLVLLVNTLTYVMELSASCLRVRKSALLPAIPINAM